MSMQQQAPSESTGGATLRELARALEDHLNANPENNVHWVGVVGEESLNPEPKLRWDKKLADSLLQVAVTQGFSEGTLVYVQAMPSRYAPDSIRSVFRIKLLSGPTQSFKTAAEVFAFINSAAFESLAMKQPQQANQQEATQHEEPPRRDSMRPG